MPDAAPPPAEQPGERGPAPIPSASPNVSFCPYDHNMLQYSVPEEKEPGWARLVCLTPHCGYSWRVLARSVIAEAQLPTREEKAAHAAGAVVNLRSELEATGTKTSAQCPSCGYGEAYYHEEQTRRADEGSTIIYQCCRCGAHWTNAQ